ncbi:MAG: hypothetical protein ACXVEM_06650 [Gaiellaceae bacterium]
MSARSGAGVLRLARRRLARTGGRYVLVVLGIAAAAAVLAGVETAGLAAGDRSLGRAMTSIDAADRGVRVDWSGIPAQGSPAFRAVDAVARRALAPLPGGPPTRALLLREAEIGGALTDLAAIDDVGRWVRLHSGRLPQPCTPTRCEVVQLAGTGRLPHLAGLNIVRVGRGSVASLFPFGPLISSPTSRSILTSSSRYHRPAAPPFLLATGVAGLATAPALSSFQRTYSWLLPLTAATVHPWSSDGFVTRVNQARSNLEAGGGAFDLQAPTDQVAQAAATARVGQRRLLLLGGAAVALLLGFVVLAAVAGRREAQATARRLDRLGARAWQLGLLDGVEAAAVALLGVVLGWLAGVGLGAVAARHLGDPAGAALAHSAGSGEGIGLAVLLAAVAATVLVLTRRSPALAFGGLSLTVVDALALGALLAILVGALRGDTDAASLDRGGGTGVFLLLLPGLVVFVAAVAAARLLYPALRLLERLARSASAPARLAVISLARSPGRAAIVVTFLVASLALALFASAYRSTLARGQSDEAAYAVPRDALARESLDTLVPVPAAAPPSAYRRLGDVAPVLRLSGDVSGLITSQGLTLLGIPPAVLPRLGGWRGDFSAISRAELARRIAAGPSAMRGIRLPTGARTLELPTEVRGTPLDVKATVMTPRGLFQTLDLGTASGRTTLRAQLPPAVRGGLVVRLSFLRGGGLPLGTNAGLGAQPVSAGTLRLGSFRAGGKAVPAGFASWTGGPGVHATGSRVRYLLTPDTGVAIGVFRARQPTDGRAIPAVVSPALAAATGRDGVLPVSVEGQPLLLRVTGVASRFPTVQGDLAVADRAAVSTAMNTIVPGTGVTNELWIAARGRSLQALRRPPFDVLDVSTRRAVLAGLREDPLGRGAVLVLGGAALTALVLALVGVLLALTYDLRDERGELFDLEAQGAEPRTLLRHLRLRFALGLGFGVAGGIVTGTILGALTVGLVRLTAGAGEPVPPLQLSIDWPLVLPALAGFVAAALALAFLVTRARLKGSPA